MRFQERIPTTAQIRKLEADWIKQCGPGWGQVLMEIAGRASAYRILDLWNGDDTDYVLDGSVAVICGRGNNGGDGLVIARYLRLWGVPVSVFLVPGKTGDDESMSTPEANTNKAILEKLGVSIQIANPDLDGDLDNASIVVDALLGTGLDRDLEGVYRSLVDAINGSGRLVVAVDIPTGINSDTGKVMGAAVQADVTVTFGYLKPGHIIYPGAEMTGQLSVVDIGLPDIDLYNFGEGGSKQPTVSLTTAGLVRSVLPVRQSNSNKGTFGTMVTVAGSLGMSGASLLSSECGLRAGAGLSLLGTPKSLVTTLPPGEVIYFPLPETADQSLSTGAIAVLKEKLEKASAVVLGPGLSTHDETVQFVHQFCRELLTDSSRPVIIDADALNAIAKNTAVLPADSRHVVITPHPKELSRLTGKSVDEIQSDRIKAAQEAASRFNCVVVLKGARTVIADPDGQTFINPTGNAGMATAGAGDVLSGIIGGLLAQHLEPLDAAVAGVYLHGTAGDIARSEVGEAGMVAGDIGKFVPHAIASVESGNVSSLEWELFGDADAGAGGADDPSID